MYYIISLFKFFSNIARNFLSVLLKRVQVLPKILDDFACLLLKISNQKLSGSWKVIMSNSLQNAIFMVLGKGHIWILWLDISSFFMPVPSLVMIESRSCENKNYWYFPKISELDNFLADLKLVLFFVILIKFVFSWRKPIINYLDSGK